jgi:hypothetical protein
MNRIISSPWRISLQAGAVDISAEYLRMQRNRAAGSCLSLCSAIGQAKARMMFENMLGRSLENLR